MSEVARSTEALVSALDPDLLAAIRIEETHGVDALDDLADDYCRLVLSVTEIAAYRQLAGVTSPRASWRSAA